jgi:bifunctional DNase/RNase
MKSSLLLALLVGFFLLPPLLAQQSEDPVQVDVTDMQATRVGVLVTLQSQDHDSLNLMIGLTEGEAIVRALRHQKTPRPMTHDLLKAFLDRSGWNVQKVIIRDLANDAYLADLIIEKDGETETFDCRPSDAIALGLRYDAKIFVKPHVFDLQRENQQEPQREQEDLSRPSEGESIRL